MLSRYKVLSLDINTSTPFLIWIADQLRIHCLHTSDTPSCQSHPKHVPAVGIDRLDRIDQYKPVSCRMKRKFQFLLLIIKTMNCTGLSLWVCCYGINGETFFPTKPCTPLCGRTDLTFKCLAFNVTIIPSCCICVPSTSANELLESVNWSRAKGKHAFWILLGALDSMDFTTRMLQAEISGDHLFNHQCWIGFRGWP